MILNELLYFIITIAILVFIHEFGHFAAAKLSGMQTDAFAIGFGYRLFGWNRVGGFSFGALPKNFDQQGHTDYRLCLLPLGGYVKIAGMIDESGDVAFMNKEPQPHEFRAQSTRKKIFVISAGVIMNLLLAYLIFWGSNFFVGKVYTRTTTLGIVDDSSSARKAGFETGDKIISINGKKIHYWEELRVEIFVNTLGQDLNVNVLRNGSAVMLNIPRKSIPADDSREAFLIPDKTTPQAADVLANSPAQKAGVKAGDIFLSINDTAVRSTQQIIRMISASKRREIRLTLLREDKDTVHLLATPGGDGKIGVALTYDFKGESEQVRRGFFKSFKTAGADVARTVEMTFVMLKRVITGQLEFRKAFGGPIKIAQFAAKSADTGLYQFIMFLGMLSLSLAIINILPIPALDGGHLLILLIERAMKREISLKVKIAVQNTGMALLLMLMAFILYNDFQSIF